MLLTQLTILKLGFRPTGLSIRTVRFLSGHPHESNDAKATVDAKLQIKFLQKAKTTKNPANILLIWLAFN